MTGTGTGKGIRLWKGMEGGLEGFIDALFAAGSVRNDE